METTYLEQACSSKCCGEMVVLLCFYVCIIDSTFGRILLFWQHDRAVMFLRVYTLMVHLEGSV